MSYASFQETLVTAQAAGAALTNSTVATSILPTHAKITLPAGNFFYIGKGLHIKASGQMSTVVTTPGTLTLDVRFGAVIVFTSQALALNVVAQTNDTWILDLDLTCRAIGNGTAANLMGVGDFFSSALAGGVAGQALAAALPATAPAVGTGFDSTSSQTVDIFATWSIANASNSIQLMQYRLTSLN